ncbi:hypothetical protein WJX77_003327 [Trebouxia sp. C0004]
MTTTFGGRSARTYRFHRAKLADPVRKLTIPSRRSAPDTTLSTVSGVQDECKQSTTARPQLNRREAVLATGGILAASACQPSCSLATQQQGLSKGSEDLTQSLEARVQEFTLSNGLHFIVLERSIAPIVSCHTYADVGAFDEVDGQTGIAHLLEHMAFKGSPRIGTKDYAKEAPILEALDEVFYSMKEAEASGRVALAQKLNDQMQKLEEQAAAFSIPNEFGATLSQAGAAGLNATTSHDATRYFMAMPANKLELWFALEAERFRAPVFRELYSEKRVVFEERRMRVDDSPMGRFQESFAAQAMTNNYRRPVIGYPADLALLGRTEVQSFFNEHYSPQRLSIAVVGDVHVDVVQKLAEKYFGGWQSMSSLPRAGSPSDTEPLPRPEGGPRHFEQGSKAGPLLMQAYYRPSMTSKDAVLLDIICDLLSGSRTSRLYTQLVETGQAYHANAVPSYPGEKHPNALVLFGQPSSGVSLQTLDKAFQKETQGLIHNGPSAKEMARIKKATKLTLVDGIRSNTNMASALCSYYVNAGSWKKLLSDLEQVDQLTAADVQAVAAATFQEDNLYTGYMLKEDPLTGKKSSTV